MWGVELGHCDEADVHKGQTREWIDSPFDVRVRHWQLISLTSLHDMPRAYQPNTRCARLLVVRPI